MQCLATWLEASCEKSLEAKTTLNAKIDCTHFTTHVHPTQLTVLAQPLNIHHLSLEEIPNWKRWGLYYNCDEKYVQGHK